ncbi:hypothetical protein K4G22_03585 [Streptomyces profundus]|nr:hypothetical protein K4G22_03585 [Streptomyces sp. MA3_2.13]
MRLGTDLEGRPVDLPAPGPAGSRIAVFGESLFGRLVALRLLAVGAQVTAVTRVPEQWQGLRASAGDRLRLAEAGDGWPRHPPAPPTVAAGPQALVTDRGAAPPAALADGPWRTVVHVTRAVPRRAAFWQRPDALLALDAAHARQVGQLLGAGAAAHVSRLAPGEIVLFRPTGPRTLRLDISPAETALLTPPQEPGP